MSRFTQKDAAWLFVRHLWRGQRQMQKQAATGTKADAQATMSGFVKLARAIYRDGVYPAVRRAYPHLSPEQAFDVTARLVAGAVQQQKR